MKDLLHHRRHIQKKVIQEVKREERQKLAQTQHQNGFSYPVGAIPTQSKQVKLR